MHPSRVRYAASIEEYLDEKYDYKERQEYHARHVLNWYSILLGTGDK